VLFLRQQHRLRLIALAALATLAALAGIARAGADSNVAPCEEAIIGSGSADWRSEALAAGPVGVQRRPLSQMSPTPQGLITKMPILIEGRAPETVTVSVPKTLRDRVFLYYGRVIGRDGKPTTLIAQARGYGETEFELCADKPRTLWPGGVRVKGRGPVHLLVEIEGRRPIRLRLGRPRVHNPSAP
jgi:hypothetical protein